MRNQQTTQNADVSKIDYGIILSVFLLAIISVLTIYSTTVLQTDGGIGTTIMQLVWYGIGIIAAAIVMHFDSEQLWKVAPIAYGAGILLLFLVLIFYDRNTYALQGAKSWFRFGGVTFQPSEVVKVALIIMLARVITEHNMQIDDRTEKTDMNLLLKIAMWSAAPLLLVILQNDLGTTLVFLAIIIGMTFLSGVSWKILLPVFGTIGAIGSLLIYLVVYNRDVLLNFGFQNYQFARIDSWLDPFGDSTGDAYQLAQSMKAIGSGKLFGKGLGVSEVYVPVRVSDMIFSTIGENFGFIGGCFLIFIYFLLIYQMIRICFDTKNEFYAYMATGVIMMILFHVLENIGMTIGLLPITGIPLPFISQGGSALLGNMLGIGLVMSMRYHYRSYMFSEEDEHFGI
ncbi:FtsW/RodA/SpoVE family cell cycle protein [Trichococcus pasteurii]|uniref:Cell cycle proteins ftsw / roda / spove signature n=1 Tax=Trichococcus pasteurii TaxID=43064 RepID=A0A1W1IFZ7_9LACT|nr:FtsW/RodA/SpoVE family cell cycle protein [Trichococcus pasteurii]SFE60557.1 rod shape determining protein RodA [Trichococcus pasteurii]SLM51809.1 cell cycle proteins ftsw / roda / spove signature [Trichococcus pasteurii]SSB92690.1 cell cycle proteins ftsw / roda / spove signature [Trichococcus pasteurii]